MKKYHVVLWMAMVGCFIGWSHAETPTPSTPDDVQAYLDKLYTKLDHTARRANEPVAGSSNVVGVRGSKSTSAQNQLYWKGKKTAAPIPVEEVKDMRAAVELARAGKKEEAILALEAFQKNYPKSVFLPDVAETLKRLKA